MESEYEAKIIELQIYLPGLEKRITDARNRKDSLVSGRLEKLRDIVNKKIRVPMGILLKTEEAIKKFIKDIPSSKSDASPARNAAQSKSPQHYVSMTSKESTSSGNTTIIKSEIKTEIIPTLTKPSPDSNDNDDIEFVPNSDTIILLDSDSDSETENQPTKNVIQPEILPEVKIKCEKTDTEKIPSPISKEIVKVKEVNNQPDKNSTLPASPQNKVTDTIKPEAEEVLMVIDIIPRKDEIVCIDDDDDEDEQDVPVTTKEKSDQIPAKLPQVQFDPSKVAESRGILHEIESQLKQLTSVSQLSLSLDTEKEDSIDAFLAKSNDLSTTPAQELLEAEIFGKKDQEISLLKENNIDKQETNVSPPAANKLPFPLLNFGQPPVGMESLCNISSQNEVPDANAIVKQINENSISQASKDTATFESPQTLQSNLPSTGNKRQSFDSSNAETSSTMPSENTQSGDCPPEGDNEVISEAELTKKANNRLADIIASLRKNLSQQEEKKENSDKAAKKTAELFVNKVHLTEIPSLVQDMLSGNLGTEESPVDEDEDGLVMDDDACNADISDQLLGDLDNYSFKSNSSVSDLPPGSLLQGGDIEEDSLDREINQAIAEDDGKDVVELDSSVSDIIDLSDDEEEMNKAKEIEKDIGVKSGGLTVKLKRSPSNDSEKDKSDVQEIIQEDDLILHSGESQVKTSKDTISPKVSHQTVEISSVSPSKEEAAPEKVAVQVVQETSKNSEGTIEKGFVDQLHQASEKVCINAEILNVVEESSSDMKKPKLRTSSPKKLEVVFSEMESFKDTSENNKAVKEEINNSSVSLPDSTPELVIDISLDMTFNEKTNSLKDTKKSKNVQAEISKVSKIMDAELLKDIVTDTSMLTDSIISLDHTKDEIVSISDKDSSSLEVVSLSDGNESHTKTSGQNLMDFEIVEEINLDNSKADLSITTSDVKTDQVAKVSESLDDKSKETERTKEIESTKETETARKQSNVEIASEIHGEDVETHEDTAKIEESAQNQDESVNIREAVAKISENIATVLQNNVKIQEDALKIPEGAMKIHEDVAKVQEDSAKSLEVVAKIQDVVKIPEHTVKIQEDTVKTQEIVAKIQVDTANSPENFGVIPEAVAKISENTNKIQQNKMKIHEDALKIPEDTTKILEKVAKVQEDSTNILEVVEKIQEDAVKIPEHKVKIQKDTVKTQEVLAKIQVDTAKFPENFGEIPEAVAKISANTAKIQQNKMKIQEDALKIPEETTKIHEEVTKVQEDSAKSLEVVAKIQEDAVKIPEHTVKIQEDTVKTQEIVAKIQVDTGKFAENIAEDHKDATKMYTDTAKINEKTAATCKLAGKIHEKTANIHETASCNKTTDIETTVDEECVEPISSSIKLGLPVVTTVDKDEDINKGLDSSEEKMLDIEMSVEKESDDAIVNQSANESADVVENQDINVALDVTDNQSSLQQTSEKDSPKPDEKKVDSTPSEIVDAKCSGIEATREVSNSEPITQEKLKVSDKIENFPEISKSCEEPNKKDKEERVIESSTLDVKVTETIVEKEVSSVDNIEFLDQHVIKEKIIEENKLIATASNDSSPCLNLEVSAMPTESQSPSLDLKVSAAAAQTPRLDLEVAATIAESESSATEILKLPGEEATDILKSNLHSVVIPDTNEISTNIIESPNQDQKSVKQTDENECVGKVSNLSPSPSNIVSISNEIETISQITIQPEQKSIQTETPAINEHAETTPITSAPEQNLHSAGTLSKDENTSNIPELKSGDVKTPETTPKDSNLNSAENIITNDEKLVGLDEKTAASPKARDDPISESEGNISKSNDELIGHSDSLLVTKETDQPNDIDVSPKTPLLDETDLPSNEPVDTLATLPNISSMDADTSVNESESFAQIPSHEGTPLRDEPNSEENTSINKSESFAKVPSHEGTPLRDEPNLDTNEQLPILSDSESMNIVSKIIENSNLSQGTPVRDEPIAETLESKEPPTSPTLDTENKKSIASPQVKTRKMSAFSEISLMKNESPTFTTESSISAVNKVSVMQMEEVSNSSTNMEGEPKAANLAAIMQAEYHDRLMHIMTPLDASQDATKYQSRSVETSPQDAKKVKVVASFSKAIKTAISQKDEKIDPLTLEKPDEPKPDKKDVQKEISNKNDPKGSNLTSEINKSKEKVTSEVSLKTSEKDTPSKSVVKSNDDKDNSTKTKETERVIAAFSTNANLKGLVSRRKELERKLSGLKDDAKLPSTASNPATTVKGGGNLSEISESSDCLSLSLSDISDPESGEITEKPSMPRPKISPDNIKSEPSIEDPATPITSRLNFQSNLNKPNVPPLKITIKNEVDKDDLRAKLLAKAKAHSASHPGQENVERRRKHHKRKRKRKKHRVGEKEKGPSPIRYVSDHGAVRHVSEDPESEFSDSSDLPEYEDTDEEYQRVKMSRIGHDRMIATSEIGQSYVKQELNEDAETGLEYTEPWDKPIKKECTDDDKYELQRKLRAQLAALEEELNIKPRTSRQRSKTPPEVTRVKTRDSESPIKLMKSPKISPRSSRSPGRSQRSPGRSQRSPIRRSSISPSRRVRPTRRSSKSPKRRSNSPFLPSTPVRHSPMRRLSRISPIRGRSKSPKKRSRSPRKRSRSPKRLPNKRRSRSPRRRSRSPRRRSRSPRRSSRSPKRRSISPRRRLISPRRRSVSPRRRRSVSPRRRRSISPRRRSISPRRRSISPRRRLISPKRRSISPRRRKSISPRRRSISPRRRSRSPRRSPSRRTKSPSKRLSRSPKKERASKSPIKSSQARNLPAKGTLAELLKVSELPQTQTSNLFPISEIIEIDPEPNSPPPNPNLIQIPICETIKTDSNTEQPPSNPNLILVPISETIENYIKTEINSPKMYPTVIDVSDSDDDERRPELKINAKVAKEAEIAKAKEAEIAKAKEAEIAKAKEAEIAKAKEAEIAKAKEAEIAKAKEAEIAKAKEAEIAKAKEAEIAKAKEAEIAKAKEAEIAKAKEAEIAKAKEAEIAKAKEAESAKAKEAEKSKAKEDENDAISFTIEVSDDDEDIIVAPPPPIISNNLKKSPKHEVRTQQKHEVRTKQKPKVETSIDDGEFVILVDDDDDDQVDVVPSTVASFKKPEHQNDSTPPPATTAVRNPKQEPILSKGEQSNDGFTDDIGGNDFAYNDIEPPSPEDNEPAAESVEALKEKDLNELHAIKVKLEREIGISEDILSQLIGNAVEKYSGVPATEYCQPNMEYFPPPSTFMMSTDFYERMQQPAVHISPKDPRLNRVQPAPAPAPKFDEIPPPPPIPRLTPAVALPPASQPSKNSNYTNDYSDEDDLSTGSGSMDDEDDSPRSGSSKHDKKFVMVEMSKLEEIIGQQIAKFLEANNVASKTPTKTPPSSRGNKAKKSTTPTPRQPIESPEPRESPPASPEPIQTKKPRKNALSKDGSGPVHMTAEEIVSDIKKSMASLCKPKSPEKSRKPRPRSRLRNRIASSSDSDRENVSAFASTSPPKTIKSPSVEPSALRNKITNDVAGIIKLGKANKAAKVKPVPALKMAEQLTDASLLTPLKEMPYDDKRKKKPDSGGSKKQKRIPKNTDMSMHCNSGEKNCLLCKEMEKDETLIGHYVNVHRENEVYVARLELGQVEALKANPNLVKPVRKSNIEKYSGTCPFCSEEMSCPIGRYMEHYASHTGEYAYECDCCGTRDSRKRDLLKHCNTACEKGAKFIYVYRYDLSNKVIPAYVCIQCNYTQLNSANVIKHIRSEHDQQQVKTSDYASITLFQVDKTEPLEDPKAADETCDKIVVNNEAIAEEDDDYDAYDNFEYAPSPESETPRPPVGEAIEYVKNEFIMDAIDAIDWKSLEDTLAEPQQPRGTAVQPETSAIPQPAILNESVHIVPKSEALDQSTLDIGTQIFTEIHAMATENPLRISEINSGPEVKSRGKTKTASPVVEKQKQPVVEEKKPSAGSSSQATTNKKVKFKGVDSSNKNITRVQSIGIEKTGLNKLKFYCFVLDCNFTPVDSLEDFRKHMRTHRHKWTGQCVACRKKGSKKYLSIDKEFLHLVNDHLPQKSYASKLLRPWIKNDPSDCYKTKDICEMLLKEFHLENLCKCMGPNCVFTTNSQKDLQFHIQLNHSEEVSALYCCYCSDHFIHTNGLVDHIGKVHGASRYQCSKCFYRSCAAYNVQMHQRTFHEDEKSLKIIVCSGQTHTFSTEMLEILDFRQRNVKPLSCPFFSACRKLIFVKHLLLDHIVKDHSRRETMDISSALYDCVYCSFGTTDLLSIRQHMANDHPSQLLYVCGLVFIKSLHPLAAQTTIDITSIKTTSLVYIGDIVSKKKFIIKDPSANKFEENSIEAVNHGQDATALNDRIRQMFGEAAITCSDVESYIRKIADGMQPDTIKTEERSELDQLVSAAIKNTGFVGKELYKCGFPKCERTFDNFEQFDRHISTHAGDKKEPIYRCPHCNRIIPTNQIRMHTIQHRRHRYLCVFCGGSSASQNLAIEHLKKTHQSQSNIFEYLTSDKDWDQKFSEQESRIFVAMPRKHDGDTMEKIVDVLRKRFNPDQLAEETPAERPESPVERKEETIIPVFVSLDSRLCCNIDACPFVAKTDEELMQHISERHLIIMSGRYSCAHCPYSLSSAQMKISRIGNHLRYHGPTIVVCNMCNYYHYNRSRVLNHINMCHPYNFVTMTLHARSTNGTKMKLEIMYNKNIRSPEDNYKCTLCEAILTECEDFFVHMKENHQLNVRFKCDMCPFFDNDLQAVEDHTKKTHSDEPRTRIRSVFLPAGGKWVQNLSPFELLFENYEPGAQESASAETGNVAAASACAESASTSPSRETTTSSNQPTVVNEREIKTEGSRKRKMDEPEAYRPRPASKKLRKSGVKRSNSSSNATTEDSKRIKISTSPDRDSESVIANTSAVLTDTELMAALESDCLPDPAVATTSEPQTKNNEVSVIAFARDVRREDPAESSVPETSNHTEQSKPDVKPMLKLVPFEKLMANPTLRQSQGPRGVGTVGFLQSAPNNIIVSSPGLNLEISVPIGDILAATENLTSQKNTRATPPTKSPLTSGLAIPISNITELSTIDAQHSTNASPRRMRTEVYIACFLCAFKTETYTKLRTHFRSDHPGGAVYFRALKKLLCAYCETYTTFNEMKFHHFNTHSSDLFITRESCNHKKCAECSFESGDIHVLKEHVGSQHPNLYLQMHSSYEFLTQSYLEDLLKVGTGKVAEVIRCLGCDHIYLQENPCKNHVAKSHPNSTNVASVRTAVRRILYGCSQCLVFFETETRAIQHIRKHIEPYGCNHCEMNFSTHGLLEDHYRLFHHTREHSYQFRNATSNFKKFLDMHLRFPNGLVLSKLELERTDFGQHDYFLQRIEMIEKNELRNWISRQERTEQIDTIAKIKIEIEQEADKFVRATTNQ